MTAPHDAGPAELVGVAGGLAAASAALYAQAVELLDVCRGHAGLQPVPQSGWVTTPPTWPLPPASSSADPEAERGQPAQTRDGLDGDGDHGAGRGTDPDPVQTLTTRDARHPAPSLALTPPYLSKASEVPYA